MVFVPNMVVSYIVNENDFSGLRPHATPSALLVTLLLIVSLLQIIAYFWIAAFSASPTDVTDRHTHDKTLEISQLIARMLRVGLPILIMALTIGFVGSIFAHGVLLFTMLLVGTYLAAQLIPVIGVIAWEKLGVLASLSRAVKLAPRPQRKLQVLLIAAYLLPAFGDWGLARLGGIAGGSFAIVLLVKLARAALLAITAVYIYAGCGVIYRLLVENHDQNVAVLPPKSIPAVASL